MELTFISSLQLQTINNLQRFDMTNETQNFLNLKISLLILFLIFVNPTFSQNKSYPKNDFISPLDIPLQLSGTFGELRTNHFHAGVDFRTQQVVGKNLVAIADGYVSRIKISYYGYGKVIYIDHPNGYTSVYGHFLRGSEKIEAYIKSKQYQQENFEIELLPEPFEVPVKQGEIIALAGNTGSSGGPHLHFEIRDTVTEDIINPMFFGYDAKILDTKSPVVNGVMVYPLSDEASVNGAFSTTKLALSKKSETLYMVNNLKAKGKIGFSINTHDLSNNSFGKNGVYKISTLVNGQKHFEVIFDRFSFKETRKINHYMDYEHFVSTGNKYQKLFMPEGFELGLIKFQIDEGKVILAPSLTTTYKIIVEDFHQNKTEVIIPISYETNDDLVGLSPFISPYKIEHKREHIFVKDQVEIYMPENTFFENFYLDFDIKDNVIKVDSPKKAVFQAFTINVKDSIKNPEKTFLAYRNKGKLSYNETSFKDGVFKAKVNKCGEFLLMQDTIAPVIKPSEFKEGDWLSNKSKIEFTISDNLSGIGKIDAYINGKWALFEYEYKNKKITHLFKDNIVDEGKNEIILKIADRLNNIAIYETHFFRKTEDNTTIIEEDIKKIEETKEVEE